MIALLCEMYLCSFCCYFSSESDPPSVTCPNDITVYTNAGQSTTNVFWNPPIATDRSGQVVLIESFPASGSEFQIGRSVVTVLAYDDADNIGICTFTVSVEGIARSICAFSIMLHLFKYLAVLFLSF